MEVLRDLFLLLGRVCISLVFLWGVFDKVRHWHATQTYMQTKNIPKLSIVLPTGLILQVIGALSVFFGWYAHLGAFLLMLVTLASLIWLHRFWSAPQAEQRAEKTLFSRDLSLLGGLLLLIALGSGAFGFN